MHRLNFKSLLLTGWLFLTVIGFVHASSNRDDMKQKTFTLEQIAKIDQIVLEGKNPSSTFYFPIPPQWRVESLSLQLFVRFSSILLPSSTLTLMAGDTPIDTITLNANQNQPMIWNVMVPNTFMKKDVLTIRLIGYMKISDQICQDIENKGNWITISGQSKASYTYSPKKSINKLKNFPQPFMLKNTPFTNSIRFILPDSLSLPEFSPYLQLAHLFSHYADWRGIQFKTAAMNELLNNAIQDNAILIGTPKSFDFKKLHIHWPMILKDQQWFTKANQPLADDAGFVYLTKHPSNSNHVLLIISANSPKGIDTALEHLKQDKLRYTAPTTLYIAKPLTHETPNSKPAKSLTFNDLEYHDQTVFGDGQQKITYHFTLPADYGNESAKLNIKYSHSPFLDTDESSYIMVTLNDLPLGGIKLNPTSSEKASLNISLPKKQLTIGKNTLTITFDLRLKDKYCTRYYLSRAWGTIYNSSYFVFKKPKKSPSRRIKYYPYLLKNQVTIGLPQQTSFYKDKTLLTELFNFVANLKAATSLTIVENHSLTEQEHAKNNLIYLGDGRSTNYLMQQIRSNLDDLFHHLSKTSSPALKSMPTSIFKNILNEKNKLGFINILAASTNSDNTQLALLGQTHQAYINMLQLLNNANQLETLSGNVAIVFPNKTYTNLSSQDIIQQVNTETRVEQAGRDALYYLLYGLLGFLVVGLVIYLIASTRNK